MEHQIQDQWLINFLKTLISFQQLLMELANNCIKLLRSNYSFISIYPYLYKVLVHGPSIIQNLQAGDF